jgi:hypothetical protein
MTHLDPIRSSNKAFKAFTGAVVLWVLVVVAFWAAVIGVLWHFIAKWW